MNTNIILLLFGLFNFILIIFFSKIRFFKLNLDNPDNKRKIHSVPVPLAGGTILFFNLILYFCLIFFFKGLLLNDNIFPNIINTYIFFIIYLGIFLLGFYDDRYNLNANIKFLILTFLILVLLILDRSLIITNIKFSFVNQTFILNYFSIPFTIFCFLVFLNAFNMFDGINLQSTLYSLIIFSSINFIYTDSLLIKILIIFLISFSYLNFKNKSFLGDSGTLSIAFIIGFIFIKLYNEGYIDTADEIVTFMIIPGIDLIRLFFLRILNKRNPLSPDNLHLHHLILSKYSLSKTLALVVALIIFPLILNYFGMQNIYALIITIILYFCLIFALRIKY